MMRARGFCCRVACHQRLRPRQAGVTLIELLASVLIFSLCIALMSNAFFQVGRLLTVVERGRDMGGAALRLSGGLQEAVANLLPVSQRSEPVFVGDGRRFAGITSRHPLGAAGQVQPLVVALDKGQVRIEPPGSQSQANAAVLAAADSGQNVRWVYQDRLGLLHGQWPVRGREQDRLPSAVFLVARAPGGSDAWPQTREDMADDPVLAQWVYAGPLSDTMVTPGVAFGGSGATR
jgi:prepilin-type N-terminal cleavage/methylation domain-containing protein